MNLSGDWHVVSHRFHVKHMHTNTISYWLIKLQTMCNTWNNYTINWHCRLKSVIIETWSPPYFTICWCCCWCTPFNWSWCAVHNPWQRCEHNELCCTLLYLYLWKEMKMHHQYGFTIVVFVWYSIALQNNVHHQHYSHHTHQQNQTTSFKRCKWYITITNKR